MPRKSQRNRERKQDIPNNPFANFDKNDPRDYAIGQEKMKDGTYRYFSGHVVAPEFVRNGGRQPAFEEAGVQGFDHGAREAHMAGRVHGLYHGYNQGGQHGFMQANWNEYLDGYDEGDLYGYGGGYQQGAYHGDHGLGDYDDYGDIFGGHAGYDDYDGYPNGMGGYGGYLGMMTSRADLAGIAGMATTGMMTLGEDTMNTMIMRRSEAMPVMVGMADTATTEVLFE